MGMEDSARALRQGSEVARGSPWGAPTVRRLLLYSAFAAADPWCSGPTCQPVTLEIAGSNPVGSASPRPLTPIRAGCRRPEREGGATTAMTAHAPVARGPAARRGRASWLPRDLLAGLVLVRASVGVPRVAVPRPAPRPRRPGAGARRAPPLHAASGGMPVARLRPPGPRASRSRRAAPTAIIATRRPTAPRPDRRPDRARPPPD